MASFIESVHQLTFVRQRRMKKVRGGYCSLFRWRPTTHDVDGIDHMLRYFFLVHHSKYTRTTYFTIILTVNKLPINHNQGSTQSSFTAFHKLFAAMSCYSTSFVHCIVGRVCPSAAHSVIKACKRSISLYCVSFQLTQNLLGLNMYGTGTRQLSTYVEVIKLFKHEQDSTRADSMGAEGRSDGTVSDHWTVRLCLFWPVCSHENIQDTTLVTCAHYLKRRSFCPSLCGLPQNIC